VQLTIGIFNDRINEIELCFEAIKQLYSTQATFETRYAFHNDDFIKMLKANALMMVYNLVESSMMGGILEIYDQVKMLGLSYNDVRKEIRDIWFTFKFNQVYDKNAHYNSYRDKALEIINGIIGKDIIELNRKATDISGNLDADTIRQVCRDHGIVFTVDEGCRGGVVLTDVKDKRNNLAHGTISFVECGRDYSLDELIKIRNETILFLTGLLDGMKTYYDNKKYLLPTV
jgi:hypothetical protein